MKKRIYRFFLLILLGLAVFFGILAYKEHRPFAEAEFKHNAVVQAVVVSEDPDENDPLKRQIDFLSLQQINSDIIGWLYIPQIGVDEPILKGQTDTEYLSKSFDGSYSPLGSVFTYAHTTDLLSDAHICLFGHNMMSGQIFGKLEKFEDTSFAEENPIFYLYTPNRTKQLQIESVFSCLKNDAVFQDDWNLNGDGSQTVTLATCTGYTQTPYRLTVNAKVIKEKLIL